MFNLGRPFGHDLDTIVPSNPPYNESTMTLFFVSSSCSKFLIYRVSGRKTGIHFCWTRSRG